MSVLQKGIRYWLLLNFLLSACQPPSVGAVSTETAVSYGEEVEDVLYLNLIWHQHQPLYFQDDEGIYTRPWVRVHATKDYYDMASILKQYPKIHATFNLTPVLIRQLDSFVHEDAKDLYWMLSEIPAEELDREQKKFILTRFFDTNWDNIIARFPRYQELLDKRGGTEEEDIAQAIETFSEADLRDLQVWFNLAWFDPDFLEKEPLKSLVEKDQDFNETDKQVVFEQVRQVMADVIAIHKDMQDAEQIEVITTPYAHPILPLVYNSDLAETGNPAADLPERFSWPNDAIAHLERSVEVYREHFGQAPQGLWPGEGAVAEEIIPLVANAGYQWMATGEPVLAASLGLTNFSRDSAETVQEADMLYRPYHVQGAQGETVAVFFRDGVLSDKVGFTYSQTPGEQAAADLMTRLENIHLRLKEEGAEGPHIVSIILDGENAWEYYPNDGKEFLHALYRQLSESQSIHTITPSEYLEMFPEQHELEDLFPGAWFSQNYDTWIGEEEEKKAWNYLGQTRDHLAKYDLTGKREAAAEELAAALDYMYLAEGSDWFWWYGSDQNSGQDEYFDESFRALQMKVFESLGDEIPDYLYVSIIPTQAVEPLIPMTDLVTPIVDWEIGEDEWTNAAGYADEENPEEVTFWIAQDAKNVYLRLDNPMESLLAGNISIYFENPGAETASPFIRDSQEQSGLSASHMIEVGMETMNEFIVGESGWENIEANYNFAWSEETLEMSLAISSLGELQEGDNIRLRWLLPDGKMLPAGGPAELTLRQIGDYTTVLEVQDALGDDNGLGSYIYPTDVVFQPGVFDIDTFMVLYDENNILFEFMLAGQLTNPWDSPSDLSLQTFDVYIDTNPEEDKGLRMLLPGRNAALENGAGWDFAIWAEGWYPQILRVDDKSNSPQTVNTTFKILVDKANSKITLRVPREVFGQGDPKEWAYAAVLLSQDGFPSTGVWRVRDVQSSASQWRLGGAPEDNNHTRIIDMVWPLEGDITQADMLSNYSASSKPEGELEADDLAQIKFLAPQE